MTNYAVPRILILILLTPSWFRAAPQDHPADVPKKTSLILEAKPTKLVYARGETVEFNFTLRNVSGSELIVARWLQLTLNVGLDISDSQGKPAKWCGRIADQVIPSKSRYKTLSPGQSLSAKLAVSCVDRDDRRHAWGYTLDVPGKYVIKAAYRLPQPKEYFQSLFSNAQVDRGPVLAEPVTIELQ